MPVKVLMDVEFGRWSTKSGITNDMLRTAAHEIEDGLVDARLGGHLIKKRVAAPGRGKRGSHRTIVAHRQGDRLIYLHGFGKKDKDNISNAERKALLKLADEYMKFDGPALKKLTDNGLLLEIKCHDQPDS